MPGFSSVANYGTAFYLSASPNVGYKVTERLLLGVGLNYNYVSIKRTNGAKFTQSIYGPSLLEDLWCLTMHLFNCSTIR